MSTQRMICLLFRYCRWLGSTKLVLIGGKGCIDSNSEIYLSSIHSSVGPSKNHCILSSWTKRVRFHLCPQSSFDHKGCRRSLVNTSALKNYSSNINAAAPCRRNSAHAVVPDPIKIQWQTTEKKDKMRYKAGGGNQ